MAGTKCRAIVVGGGIHGITSALELARNGMNVTLLEKNNDYRDGYLQLAILEYKLRDYSKAQLYLGKALEIDPNFEKAKELGKALSIKQ